MQTKTIQLPQINQNPKCINIENDNIIANLNLADVSYLFINIYNTRPSLKHMPMKQKFVY